MCIRDSYKTISGRIKRLNDIKAMEEDVYKRQALRMLCGICRGVPEAEKALSCGKERRPVLCLSLIHI